MRYTCVLERTGALHNLWGAFTGELVSGAGKLQRCLGSMRRNLYSAGRSGSIDSEEASPPTLHCQRCRRCLACGQEDDLEQLRPSLFRQNP